jgi:hypothetical protein
MSLLLTAASELKLRNDDCAESGSFFIMARSLIEAENCAIEPLSDIWIREILRLQACLITCDALPLFINTRYSACNATRGGVAFKMPALGGVSRTDHYRYSVRSIEKMKFHPLGRKKKKTEAMSVR